MRMQEGGVGFYPNGMTPWVHIDSGDGPLLAADEPRRADAALPGRQDGVHSVRRPADAGLRSGEGRDRAARRRGPDGRAAADCSPGCSARAAAATDDAEEAGGQEAVVAANDGGRGGRGGGAAGRRRPRRSRSPTPDRRRWRKPSAACRRVRPTPNPAPARPKLPPQRRSLSPSRGCRGARTAEGGERRRDRRSGQAHRTDRGALSRALAAAPAAQPRAATGAAGRHSPAPDPAGRVCLRPC